MFALFRRRTVYVPTWFGCLVLLAALVTPITLWTFWGEEFLSTTSKVPAEVLIVEGWTHEDGADAAAAEFARPSEHYQYIVAAGGLTGERWFRARWSDVGIIHKELLHLGISDRVVIGAQAPDVDSQRTYQTALTAVHVLEQHGIHPATVNILTRGVHARRSRLVYAKAFGPHTRVGVIAWTPPGFDSGQWWSSSERAIDFIKESVGYFYEALFSSGRAWRHTPAVLPTDSLPTDSNP
jgi:hypothetical protein